MKDWNALAGLLLAALGDHVAEQGRPTWVQVLDPPDGGGDLQLVFSDRHPGFMGWVAPPDCQAAGLVATGRAWAAEPEVDPSPGMPGRPASGVRLACVLARDGTVGWRMVLPDGAVMDEAPCQGKLVDCLRRCFGLPTPPPPTGAGLLQSVFWVLTVLDAAGRSSRPLTWRQVACLHPLARACAHPGTPAQPAPQVPALAGVARATLTWEMLRLHAGLWATDLVSPEIAAWMDDGMFARWVLSQLPDPEQLIRRVRPFLTPSAARRLAHAMRWNDGAPGRRGGFG
jgi:hypothetical protein